MSIQLRVSVSCISAVLLSKYAHSSVEMPKVTAVVSTAIQRPSTTPRSPSASMTAPPAIGSQMSTLSIGQSSCIAFLLPQHVPRQQRRQSDDHREGVVIEISRLQVA